MEQVTELDFRRHADDLRETWQARALAYTRRTPLGAVILSVLAHNWDDSMPTLLRVVFPGFVSITAPFICSPGKIAKTGHVMADMVTPDGQIVKNHVIFLNEYEMRKKLRHLADQLRLTDRDRIEMFIAARRWVVCDYRLDPTMDPQDPDAKRLTAVH